MGSQPPTLGSTYQSHNVAHDHIIPTYSTSEPLPPPPPPSENSPLSNHLQTPQREPHQSGSDISMHTATPPMRNSRDTPPRVLMAATEAFSESRRNRLHPRSTNNGVESSVTPSFGYEPRREPQGISPPGGASYEGRYDNRSYATSFGGPPGANHPTKDLNWAEREIGSGVYNPSLHLWNISISSLRRLFGVYDEELQAQATLDMVTQQIGEMFAEFLIRFEDASLLTEYNTNALKWRLVAPIRGDLRNRITYIGGIPNRYEDVIQPTGSSRGYRAGQRVRGRQIDNAQGNAAYTGAVAGTPQIMRITRQEREQWMINGLCFKCGEEGHFGQNCPNPPVSNVLPVQEAGRVAYSFEELPQELDVFTYSFDGNDEAHEVEAQTGHAAQEQSEGLEHSPGKEGGIQDLKEGEN
ncbi:hypothetical protein PQX77_008087 [Marasmius sp. AFHP31]|nr:hypothetical protein PQX77_008087 [Marasmius sp. AFHP31]